MIPKPLDARWWNDSVGLNIAEIRRSVRLIEHLRSEWRTVLMHCVACQSRTPTVAALYGARRQGISGELALQAPTKVLPGVTTQPAETVIAVLSSHRAGASINAAARASGINFRTAQRIVEGAAQDRYRKLLAVG